MEEEKVSFIEAVQKAANKVFDALGIDTSDCIEDEEETKETYELTLYETLTLQEALKQGFSWIARDNRSISELYVYKQKPTKAITIWYVKGALDAETYTGNKMFMKQSYFPFIKCEDEEPHYIQDILDNCIIVADRKDDEE